MIELALKYKEYILKSMQGKTASNGGINRILVNKYREEINPNMKPCSKCLLTIIIPAYKKILDEQ